MEREGERCSMGVVKSEKEREMETETAGREENLNDWKG